MTQTRYATVFLLLLGCGRTELPSELIAPADLSGGDSNRRNAPTSGGAVAAGGSQFTGGSGGVATGDSQPNHKVAVLVNTGAAHTCALMSNGLIECWGMNGSGELGDGTFVDSSVPVQVQGVTDATLVVTGYDHTCALVNGGQVKCWGSNDYGQLGNGSNIGSARPLSVPAITGAVGLDVGGLPAHTCALTRQGRVFCWGNAYLDAQDPNNSTLATPTAVPDISTATAISVGIGHSCAQVGSDRVYCWGANDFGQLGNGTTQDAAEPSRVVMDTGTAAVALAAGGNNTCVVVADSRVQCWGSNGLGQLGTQLAQPGPGVVSTVPLTVDGVDGAVRIAVGSQHVCVTSNTGNVQCWGSNLCGELGDGTTNDSNRALTVNGISNATGVAAGGHHTCAIADDGRVLCWGSNLFGQLGDGSTNDRWLPANVIGF